MVTICSRCANRCWSTADDDDEDDDEDDDDNDVTDDDDDDSVGDDDAVDVVGVGPSTTGGRLKAANDDRPPLPNMTQKEVHEPQPSGGDAFVQLDE